MDFVTINVTQLCCFCLDPDWRDRWLRGENPSPKVFAPPGTVAVYGTQFHSLAKGFVNWLVAPASEKEASRLNNEQAVFQALSRRGAGDFLTGILERGEIDSAAALTDALHHFSRRLSQLQNGHPGFRTWRDVFFAQEYAIKDVHFKVHDRSIFISGIIDCLRNRPEGRLEAVDYKLTKGADLQRELVQLAIYRQLLKHKKAEFDVSGSLEYFLPALHVQEVTSRELEDIFSELVKPCLVVLVGGPSKSADKMKEAPAKEHPISFILGKTRDFAKRLVAVEPPELTRHCAILGGSGSGKTTLALNLVEQLIISGIPAILVDRKGDLCRYALKAAWEDCLPDQEALGRRQQLKDAIDVALFTPGHSGGRPLSISVAPPGLGDMPSSELEQSAKIAASALASMMNYKSSANDQAKLAILTKAVVVLSQAQTRGDSSISLDELLEFINQQDESLVRAVGYIDTKHFKKLVENLQTLQIMNGDLLGTYPDRLDAEALLGLNEWKKQGKTRLSIISTKFLGGGASVLFWVTQLLVELGRFASKKPSPHLQGVVLFDEADMYLPAVSKPPTKEPMENLLRRARSAGIGILLVSQSPGDFDYKCKENVRTWFLGLIKEKTAIEKMKPMLAEAKVDVAAKLPSQQVGQFFVIREGRVDSLAGDPSLIKTEQLTEVEILGLARQGQE